MRQESKVVGAKDKKPAEELFGVARGLDLYGELLKGRREDEGAEFQGYWRRGSKGHINS